MFSDDKKDKLALPVFNGVKDRSQFNQMINRATDATSFQKIYRTNPDGSVTRIETKGGMPQVFHEAATIPTGCIGPCGIPSPAHGYIDNGFIGATAFPAGALYGDTYLLNKTALEAPNKCSYAIIAGANHHLAGENLGATTWIYVDSAKKCWRVVASLPNDGLTSVTLSFYPFTGANKPIPETPTQTVELTGATILDVTGATFYNRVRGIEDIATNGTKAVISLSTYPSSIRGGTPSDGSSQHTDHIGRFVIGAKEITISGIPPAATVNMATLYTDATARATLNYLTNIPTTLKVAVTYLAGSYFLREYTGVLTLEPGEVLMASASYGDYEYSFEYVDALVGLRYDKVGALEALKLSAKMVNANSTTYVRNGNTIDLSRTYTSTLTYTFDGVTVLNTSSGTAECNTYWRLDPSDPAVLVTNYTPTTQTITMFACSGDYTWEGETATYTANVPYTFNGDVSLLASQGRPYIYGDFIRTAGTGFFAALPADVTDISAVPFQVFPVRYSNSTYGLQAVRFGAYFGSPQYLKYRANGIALPPSGPNGERTTSRIVAGMDTFAAISFSPSVTDGISEAQMPNVRATYEPVLVAGATERNLKFETRKICYV